MKDGYLLEMKQIDKQFPGVHALDHVDFRVRPGEIHALMGENGAGKSTLMKVLTGVYRKDEGTILLDGQPVDFQNPHQSQIAGISTIYQEVNLIPYLSVAENIYLGRELMKRGGIDWKQERQGAREILREMGLEIDVTQPLCSFGTAVRQMTAIARAIFVQAKLLVMDEPTSSLDEKEVAVLFRQMRKLRDKGLAMIFISHRLDEIFEICDTVTILKDGRFVHEESAASLTKMELVSRMIGRDAAEVLRCKNNTFDEAGKSVILEASDISDPAKLRGVNLRIREGEIVGLAGLLGAGRTELAKVIFGDQGSYQGQILIDGKPVRLKAPRDAIRHGFAYCSEDRKTEGIFPFMSVKENMTMALLPRIARLGVVRGKRQRETVQQYISELRIKTPTAEQLIRNLSGGNQQKVLLARWLCMQPRLIILDEPTRGIDVGAKSEIEALIQEIAWRSISVLFISSELEELVRNCHRVVVIRDGRDIGELSGAALTEANIMQLIAQGGEVAETEGDETA